MVQTGTPKMTFESGDAAEKLTQQREKLLSVLNRRGGKEKQRIEDESSYVLDQKWPAAADFVALLESKGMEEHAKVYQGVLKVAQAVKKAGGRCLLVGGSVRDMLVNKIPKDFDVEVYGLRPEQIEAIASTLGKVSDVGKAFGILKVSLGKGVDIDLSLPRTDSKTGEGHKGFQVKTDPFMSVRDAAKRRDFTFNSMCADPLTQEIFDPFGGAKDLKERLLRVTDNERFCDDPLRVMRALQFVGRLGLSIAPESIPVITSMVPKLKELARERIFEEWKKLLLKSEKPSLGLAAGMALGVFKELHPEFPPLVDLPQSPEWHSEGDAWVHTLMTVDESARIIRRERLSEDMSLTMMFSALCHDLGKPYVTEFKQGKWISSGHEAAGEEPTRKFLAGLGAPNEITQKVLALVVNHLTPTLLYTEEKVRQVKITDAAVRRLAERVHPATIYDLVLLSEADHSGRGPLNDPEIPEQLLYPASFPQGTWLLERARAIGVEKSKPANLIEGKDLINLGFKPGRHMGELIRLGNQLRDEKLYTKEMVLQAVFEYCQAPEQAVATLKTLL